MNQLLVLSSVFLNLVAISLGDCGEWTAWVGDCRLQFCGECNSQSRTRTCTLPTEVAVDLRNCYNVPCLFPCPTCEPICRKTIIGKQFGCVAKTFTAAYASDVTPTVPVGANAHSATCASSRVTIPPPLNV